MCFVVEAVWCKLGVRFTLECSLTLTGMDRGCIHADLNRLSVAFLLFPRDRHAASSSAFLRHRAGGRDDIVAPTLDPILSLNTSPLLQSSGAVGSLVFLWVHPPLAFDPLLTAAEAEVLYSGSPVTFSFIKLNILFYFTGKCVVKLWNSFIHLKFKFSFLPIWFTFV